MPVEFKLPVAEPGLAELDPARLPTESPLEALRDATRPVRPAIARFVTDPKLCVRSAAAVVVAGPSRPYDSLELLLRRY